MKDKFKALFIKNLTKGPESYGEPLVLIPKPKEITQTGNKNAYSLSSDCVISFVNVHNHAIVINDIYEFLNDNFNINVKQEAASYLDQRKTDDKSKKDLLDASNEEAYNLSIGKNKISIYSLSEKGLFYGCQTLLQILKNSFLNDKSLLESSKEERISLLLPEVNVKDIPDLKIRGVADDISRGQVFTVESAKRYIKILSHYKMNFYCLYIEDMFAHPKHPKIGKDRGALTIKEIKEIDKYAKERFVELVPIFECLGHVENIMYHEEYEHLGEFPGSQCLDVSNPEIFPFLEDYISELSKCFSTKYFHIGCDESFDLGKIRSKEYVKKHGKTKVLVDFYEKIYQIVRKYENNHVIMYDDIVRNDNELLKILNKDIILMYWNYKPQKQYKEVAKFLKAGHKVIVSPSMLSWLRNFPDNKNSSKNTINLTREAYENRNKGCLGVITCSWGDQRYYSFRENEIFNPILTAAISWTFKPFDYTNFKSEYGFLFYGIERELLKKFNEMFTLLSSSASHYYRVNIRLPPFFFTYLFKHPFPTKKYEPSFKEYDELGRLASKCLVLYYEIKPNVVFERKNYEYIEYGAELAKFLCLKTDLSLKVSKVLENPKLDEELIEILISEIKNIKDKLTDLRVNYEKLWLRAAKRPCLDSVLELFDFLLKSYTEKISQIREGICFVNPFLESEWIWTEKTPAPEHPVYFRKIIDVNQPVRKALIQGMACEHMKIYLNDKMVGEVKSRFSLSPLPINLRVKVFDISENLKQGKNILAIEAYDYEGFKGAINLYGECILKDGSIQEILSDSSWICYCDEIFETNDWLKLEFDESTWIPVLSHGSPPNLNGDINKPNLLKGERSVTQDYFGILNDMGNFIPRKLVSRAVKLLKPFG